MTPEQQAALDAARATIAARQQAQQQRTAQTEESVGDWAKLRLALGQGLLMGWGDEAEALVRSQLQGIPYEQAVADIRQNVQQYREENPWTAAALEFGGALLPTAGAIMTGAGAPAGLGRLAMIGATQGAVAGAGAADPSAEEDGVLARVPGAIGGAAVGGALAPAVSVAGQAAGQTVAAVPRAIRRVTGGPSRAFTAEINRIARISGLTPEEIADRIARGEVLAEMPLVVPTAREYAGGSRPEGAIMREGLERRPEQTRAAALGELERQVAGRTGPARLSQAEEYQFQRASRGDLYAPFENVEAPQPLVDAFSDVLRRAPEVGSELSAAYRARTGASPFFTITDDAVEFARTPTIAEIERARSILSEQVSSLYRSGRGSLASTLNDLEEGLRRALDDFGSVQSGGQTRSVAATRRTVAAQEAYQRAFDAGQRAGAGGNVQDSIMAAQRALADENTAPAFRRGFVAAIQQRMATPARVSAVRSISDPESGTRQILEMIYPGEDAADLIRRFEVAQQSEAASGRTGRIFGGSDTQRQRAAESRIGTGMRDAAEVAAAASGDTGAMINVVDRMMTSFASNLSPADRQRVARVLVEQNPQMVMDAMRDPAVAARMARAISSLTSELAPRVGRAAGVTGAIEAQPYNPLRIEVNRPRGQ